jgi:hypothetical protein
VTRSLPLRPLAAFALALLALSTPAAAQDGRWGRSRGASIELFDQPGFNGRSRAFSGDIGNLDFEGFNDAARSVRISGGAWELCEHADFGGRCIRIDRNEPDLSRIGFSATASSFRRVSGGWGGRDDDWRDDGVRGGGIRFFEGEGFAGRSLELQTESDNFDGLRFNDRARSLSTRGRWVVCSDAFFRGTCRTVEGEIPDLRAIGLTAVISSARPVDGWSDDRGGGWNNGGWQGGDWGQDRPAATGRTSAFFPAPRVGGRPLNACEPSIARGRGNCAQDTADAFCSRQGYRAAAYFSQSAGGRRGGGFLEEVLCVR